MRNILSYHAKATFSGREILAWANHQVKKHTSHKKQGAFILSHYGNINPQRHYHIQSSYEGTGCGEVIKQPRVIGVYEMTIK